MSSKLTGISGIIILIAAFVGFNALYTVNQVQQALVLQFGDPRDIITKPGLKVKMPFIQNVVFYDNRILDYDQPVEEVIASDQKRMVIDVFSRYRITDPLKFYQTVGSEAAVRNRLNSIINGALRRVVGNVPLASLLSAQRETIMGNIRDAVNQEAHSFGVDVLDVRIRRADLPEANSEAIFNRMKTEREREAKEFRAEGAEAAQRIRAKADKDRTILLAKAQKKSEILRGEGEGTRARIFAQAAGQDKEFYSFYRSMQAYREHLGGDSTSMVLSPDSDFFEFFNKMGGQ